MKNFFEEYEVQIGDMRETAFHHSNNVFQDGTTPMYRDKDGKLWAITGHSHMGQIAMFCGTCLNDFKKVYDIQTNFCVGHADYAYNGVRYPEGVKARGSIWPFGLYICPGTHRFHVLFHNEAGWFARGTAYDAFGPCMTPKCDSDFRHIGLMHSDDEGRTWTFDRWVLSGEQVCFTEKYCPEKDAVRGQKAGVINLGSGDFSVFTDHEHGYIYIFYNMITFDMNTDNKNSWMSCNAYVARSRMRKDGIMGDFVKYHDGAFCEAGNFGKETPIAFNAWHPRVVFNEKYSLYLMTCTRVTPGGKQLVDDVLQVRTSADLVHWSEPICVLHQGVEWGNHYHAIVPDDDKNQPNIVEADTFSLLTNHNGKDVMRYAATIRRK